MTVGVSVHLFNSFTFGTCIYIAFIQLSTATTTIKSLASNIQYLSHLRGWQIIAYTIFLKYFEIFWLWFWLKTITAPPSWIFLDSSSKFFILTTKTWLLFQMNVKINCRNFSSRRFEIILTPLLTSSKPSIKVESKCETADCYGSKWPM